MTFVNAASRLIPESPRWQLTKGDTESAVEYFRRSARYSNMPIPDNLEIYLEHQVKWLCYCVPF